MAGNVDLEAQWLKRELEKTYPGRGHSRTRLTPTIMRQSVCLRATWKRFADSTGGEPAERLEWLTWRRDRRREEIELMRAVMRKHGLGDQQ
jgi:hypothetical protein